MHGNEGFSLGWSSCYECHFGEWTNFQKQIVFDQLSLGSLFLDSCARWIGGVGGVNLEWKVSNF